MGIPLEDAVLAATENPAESIGVEKDYGKIAVGRIKTVALFLIYLRELAIRDFVPTTYWELEATFEHPNGIYKGNYIPIDIPYSKGDKKGEPWEGDCSTREDWEKLIQNPKLLEIVTKELSLNMRLN